MRYLSALPVLAVLLLSAPVHAGDAAHVQVEHAWIRLLPASLPAGGYATLNNSGDKSIALIGASSIAYGNVMLHQSTITDGVSHMSMVSKLMLPAHAKVALAPGGYHLMLLHAKHPLKPGDVVKVKLHFADNSTLDANFLVRPANASGETD